MQIPLISIESLTSPLQNATNLSSQVHIFVILSNVCDSFKCLSRVQHGATCIMSCPWRCSQSQVSSLDQFSGWSFHLTTRPANLQIFSLPKTHCQHQEHQMSINLHHTSNSTTLAVLRSLHCSTYTWHHMATFFKWNSSSLKKPVRISGPWAAEQLLSILLALHVCFRSAQLYRLMIQVIL